VGRLKLFARQCIDDNQFDYAIAHLLAALECNKTDISALHTLSHIYVHALNTPARAVELLQPHYRNTASNGSEALVFLSDKELTCTYMQALVQDQTTTRAVLPLLEQLQQHGIALDACMLSTHTKALYELKYYVDAYQVATDFVQKHPQLPSSHAWMGQTLSALRRNEEATSVLHVARALVREDERWNADLPLLKRLGDAFHYVNATEAAADMYGRVLPAMQGCAVLRDQRCEILLRQGKLLLELNRTHSAYVTMLQSDRDCPGNPLTTLHLGMTHTES
jgi:tetratricopeptide (TPR) repeat protein